MPDREAVWQWGSLNIVPYVPYSQSWTYQSRRLLESFQPKEVYCSCPPSMGPALIQGVRELPQVAVIFAEEETGLAWGQSLEPAHTVTELVRWSQEQQASLHCLGHESYLGLDDLLEAIPDSSLLWEMGFRGWWLLYQEQSITLSKRRKTQATWLAWKLKSIEEHASQDNLVFIPVDLVRQLQTSWEEEEFWNDIPPTEATLAWATKVLSRVEFQRFHHELPLLSWVYEQKRQRDLGGLEPWVFTTKEGSSSVVQGSVHETIQDTLRENFLDLLWSDQLSMPTLEEDSVQPLTYEQKQKLTRWLEQQNDISGSLGALMGWDFEALEAFEQQADLGTLHQEQIKEKHGSLIAQLQEELTLWVDKQQIDQDRNTRYLALWSAVELLYKEEQGQSLEPWQIRLLQRYLRKYTFYKKKWQLTAMELSLVARSCVDHNYGYYCWLLVTFYPWSREESEFEQEPSFKGFNTNTWDLQRTTSRFHWQEQKVESYPGEWGEHFRGSICSFSPEDIYIESFGVELKKRGVDKLFDSRARTQPMFTSMLDGIDIRETIRNWWQDQQLYVRESVKRKEQAGAVVMVFTEPAQEEDYPWRMTWQGEHDQESDMAFFATRPMERLIGPGIARCRYGGFALTYPPRRMFDVWSDPWYAQVAINAREYLVLAALDYGEGTSVIYVGPSPLRPKIHLWAARRGKKIITVPLGEIAPSEVARLRQFHVLGGHQVRAWAEQYIKL